MFIFLPALPLAMSFQDLIKFFHLNPFILNCFINHSKTVLCQEVIANGHAKRGVSVSSPPLSSQWARMTANLLVEILLKPSKNTIFALIMFSVMVSQLVLSNAYLKMPIMTFLCRLLENGNLSVMEKCLKLDILKKCNQNVTLLICMVKV